MQTNKAILRTKFRKLKLQLLTKDNTNPYHSGLCLNFIALLKMYELFPPGTRPLLIGSYINKPISEIIPPMIHSHQFSYAFPYFSSKSRDMNFYEHCPSDKYEMGSYGIRRLSTPFTKKEVNFTMDVVLVPLVSFTAAKHRIGEGGGYYDQFISKSRVSNGPHNSLRNAPIKFVGVALEQLKYEGNDSEIFSEWDQKLDAIITQTNIYA
jgi:5,10-methenyltetrahydrofolate synthetase